MSDKIYDTMNRCHFYNCINNTYKNCMNYCSSNNLDELCTTKCETIMTKKKDEVSLQYIIFGSAYNYFNNFMTN